MKTDFTISVNLGVTPELAGLVAYVLSSLGKKPDKAEEDGQKEDKTEVATRDGQSNTSATPKSQPGKGEVIPPEELIAKKPEEAQAEQSEQPTAKPETEAAKKLTEADVRAAMERARVRIEGEDYKDNTDGERYKTYHSQLTATFKNIAATLGSEKPSKLPDIGQEATASFIAQCDELTAENGVIVTPAKF